MKGESTKNEINNRNVNTILFREINVIYYKLYCSKWFVIK